MRYVLTGLWLLALPANAQVYLHINADGTTHYSHTPLDLADTPHLTRTPLNRQPAWVIVPAENPQHLLPEQEPVLAPYNTLMIRN